jgi:putative addiction module component (TIGR02574 family)
MSKSEILLELPKLKPEERQEVLEELWDLQEQDAVRGGGPSPEERALLDRELQQYQQTPAAGAPWKEVEQRLRAAK